MKKIISMIIIIVSSIFILMQPVKGAISTKDYEIKNYDIDMKVNEDNSFDITETIKVYFNVEKHGIYRKIPRRNILQRTDGTKNQNRAKITNVKINEKYTKENSDGYTIFKIGSKSQTYIGEKTYVIKYKYSIGKDPILYADELYYNLIGNEWDTTIDKCTFRITMPKKFNSTTLGFSTGEYGETDSSNVYYNESGNVITGGTYNTLNEGEGVTVRLILPEGYFSKNNISTEQLYGVIVIAMSILFMGISYWLWSKYGMDDQVVDTVEFYPPDGLNSAEMTLAYNGNATDKGIIALLIHLANKGYLRIEEIEERRLFSKKKGFKIIKIRDYYENNESEKIFFDGLFKETYNVSPENLVGSFYKVIDEIKSKLNTKENVNNLFEKASTSKAKWLLIMAIILYVTITIYPICICGGVDIYQMLHIIFIPIIGYVLFYIAIVNNYRALISKKILEKSLKIIGQILFLTMLDFPVLNVILPILRQNLNYLVPYTIGIIGIIIISCFIVIIPKRTKYGNEILGKIRGFKRFLEIAEKPELEVLVEKNPNYFYDILPYTYALGVSNKWIKKFEKIAVRCPAWYYSYDAFDIYTFGKFMNNTMKSTNFAMTSISTISESSFSDSFGSGGGFSGGGSGGGGGGSW